MIELHPEILEKDGKKQFVILPYEEFAAIQEALADADDLAALRAAKKEEHAAPGITLEKLSRSWGYPVRHFLTHASMAERVKVCFDPEADYLVEIEGVD